LVRRRDEPVRRARHAPLREQRVVQARRPRDGLRRGPAPLGAYDQRQVTLRLRDRSIEFITGEPLLMGIVNANPDSFSDVVRLDGLDRQVEHALALVADGAAMIDVGGESGVTYTEASAHEVEAERVVPLVRRLVADGVTVSVDTWKAGVAEQALEAGAHLINDTSGLADPRIAYLCAASGAGLVVMHTRAVPKEVGFPDYGGDVRGDVVRLLGER